MNGNEFYNVKKIIVHGGQSSHMDEQVACAIAIAFGAPLIIERRDPSVLELDDDRVLVLDVGGQHSHTDNNYDHHQLDKELTECSYSLLAQHLGIEDELRAIYDWYDLGVELDCHGPSALAEQIGCSTPNLLGVLGPAREYHDVKWAQDELYRNRYTSWLAHDIQSKLKIWAMLDTVPGVADCVQTIEGLRVLRSDKLTALAGLNGRAAEKAVSDVARARYEPAAVVFNDDRGPGLGILRIDDNPRLDFSTCSERDDVLFASPHGFIVKTKTKDADVADIIKAALVD